MSEQTAPPEATSFEEWLERYEPSNYSDNMEDAYQHGRSSRNAEVCRLLDTIRGLRAENADLKAERGRHLDAIRSLKEVAARHE